MTLNKMFAQGKRTTTLLVGLLQLHQYKSPINVMAAVERSFSLSSSNVTVEHNQQSAVAVLKMHARPVNSFTSQLMQDLTAALKGLEKTDCKAVILSSSIPKIFCAGLDFKEIAKSTPDYFQSFEEFVATVYTTRFPIISAIDGAAIAGGCILALTTDYRIMSHQGTIGLNETLMGLPLKSSINKLCASVVGTRNAELMCLTGELLKSEKALRWGLIDDVASDANELMDKAESQAKIYANIPNIDVYYITKMEGRRELADFIRKGGSDEFRKLDMQAIRKGLLEYATKLKQK